MSAQLLIRFTRGDDYRLSIAWWDSQSQPVPLADARLQARTTYDSPVPFIDLGVGSGLSLDTAGQVDIHFSPDDSQDVAGTGVWDLEVTSAAGQVMTLAAGRIIIDRDVSRA